MFAYSYSTENREFKLITPKYTTGTLFGAMATILDFSKGYFLAVLRFIELEWKT